jgi:hypothetical protein
MSGNLPEEISLNLLQEIQAELAGALGSLAGQQAEGLVQSYLVYSASAVNRATEGYLHLRRSGRIEASKLLIRTTLEVLFRIRAVQAKPELMFRIAFTEFQDDKKWIRSLNQRDVERATRTIAETWVEFKKVYQSAYPKHSCEERELTLREAAEAAGLDPCYNSFYRLYCRFTHGAFRATTGYLNEFENRDTRLMALCACAAIESIESAGASAPNLEILKQRLFQDEQSSGEGDSQ